MVWAFLTLECAKDDIVKACYLIAAVLIVHNFLIYEGDETSVTHVRESIEDDDEENEGDIEAIEHDEDYVKTRDILLQHVYWRNS